MEKNKNLGILLTVFIIATLALGGYILYDSVIIGKPSCERCDEGESSEVVNTVSVVEGAGFADTTSLFRVMIPKIVGSVKNTGNIEKLNQTILEDGINRALMMFPFNANEYTSNFSKGANLNYVSLIKGDILVININEQWLDGSSGPQYGPGTSPAFAYYYDIKNDKILNLSETAQILGLSFDSVYYCTDGTDKKVTSYSELVNVKNIAVVVEKNNVILKNSSSACM